MYCVAPATKTKNIFYSRVCVCVTGWLCGSSAHTLTHIYLPSRIPWSLIHSRFEREYRATHQKKGLICNRATLTTSHLSHFMTKEISIASLRLAHNIFRNIFSACPCWPFFYQSLYFKTAVGHLKRHVIQEC